MKKTFAVILSIVMLLCCIPVASNAATHNIQGDFERSDQLVSRDNYNVVDGTSLTVPSNMTAYVPSETVLTILPGAKLNVLGTLIVLGTLDVKGSLYGAENIIVNKGGSATADVRFPSLSKVGLEDKIRVYYGASTNGNIYEDQQQPPEDFFTYVIDQGTTVAVDINQYIYVKVEIVEPDDKYDMYDDSKMNVYFNTIGVPYTQGSHHTLLTNSVDVTYSKWTKDNDFYNSFNIYLPTGEGYTVYGREGEQSALGETVKLPYGQPFSFRVEIDPEYDMSAYEVYIYNGYGWTNLDTSTLLKDIAPAEPDKDGYYYIESVKGEHTIYVVGVVKNETLLMVGDVLDLVRNIFEMISAFFGELLAMLGLGGTTA